MSAANSFLNTTLSLFCNRIRFLLEKKEVKNYDNNDRAGVRILKKASDIAIAAAGAGGYNKGTLADVIEETFNKMIELAKKQ